MLGRGALKTHLESGHCKHIALRAMRMCILLFDGIFYKLLGRMEESLL